MGCRHGGGGEGALLRLFLSVVVMALLPLQCIPSSLPSQPSPSGQAPAAHTDIPPPPNTTFTMLDTTCGIQYAPAFLSNAEIMHVMGVVERTGGWAASPTGGKQFLVPAGIHTGTFLPALDSDDVITRIEERIAHHTGTPRHPHEDRLSLAMIKPRGQSPHGGFFFPFGLHHDSDTRPNRVRTAIVYLTTPEKGGRTAFPICGPQHDSEALREVRAEFYAALAQQWGGEAARVCAPCFV